MIKIEKGIKLPPFRIDPHEEMIEAMRTMELGDSFLSQVKYPGFFYNAAERANIKVAVRLVDQNSNGSKAKGTLREYRVWRIN